MKLLLIQSLAVVFASAGVQAESSPQLRGQASNEEGEDGKCCKLHLPHSMYSVASFNKYMHTISLALYIFMHTMCIYNISLFSSFTSSSR